MTLSAEPTGFTSTRYATTTGRTEALGPGSADLWLANAFKVFARDEKTAGSGLWRCGEFAVIDQP